MKWIQAITFGSLVWGCYSLVAFLILALISLYHQATPPIELIIETPLFMLIPSIIVTLFYKHEKLSFQKKKTRPEATK
jgi:hypothetical protein